MSRKPSSKRPQRTLASFEQDLKRHPELKPHMETLLAIVENRDGRLERFAEAELEVLKVVRRLGRQTLEEWAQQQADRKAAKSKAATAMSSRTGSRSPGPGGRKPMPKRCWHSAHCGLTTTGRLTGKIVTQRRLKLYVTFDCTLVTGNSADARLPEVIQPAFTCR